MAGEHKVFRICAAIAACLPTIVAGAAPTNVAAGVGSVVVYPVPAGGTMGAITFGPDGNFWFLQGSSCTHFPCYVGQVTPAGTMTQTPISGADEVVDISSEIDGSVWYTTSLGASLVRVTPLTQFNLPAQWGCCAGAITSGPDGAIWLVDGGVVRIGTNGATRYQLAGGAADLTTGPDGALWFTDDIQNKIGRITTAGVVTEFGPLSGFPQGIVAGSDGNLWFTEQQTATTPAYIGRITTGGVISEFSVPSAGQDLVFGPDGRIWFTAHCPAPYNCVTLGAMTASGAVRYVKPIPNFAITGLAVGGADGNVWWTAEQLNTGSAAYVGKIQVA